MKLLICAGGTGGGVYPALAVHQALRRKADRSRSITHLETLWVGGTGGIEETLVEKTGIAFESIPAAGVHGVGLRALPGNSIQLSRGYLGARKIIKNYRPDVLFFTGGYIAVPMAFAGRKQPSLLYVPDIEPGLALKTVARNADCIAVSVEESRTYFPRHAQVEVTGYPTRTELASWDMDNARQALGLVDHLPTLLVYGGSTGARSINRALLPVLPQLLEEMQVVHISGQLDWAEVEQASANLATVYKERYRAYPYLHEEMGAALRAADLVLSRAGASTLGEFPLFGLPAVLVPYPYAWRYQKINAQYLETRGAAMVIADSELPEQLLPTVLELMRNQDRLETMKKSMLALAQPEAADNIAHLLIQLADRYIQKRK